MIDMNHREVRDASDASEASAQIAGVSGRVADTSGDMPKVDDFMDALTFTDEPATLPPVPDADVMVVRSLRLPLALETRARAVATARGVPYTTLIREWIIDGLERDEAGDKRDAVTELRRIATAASRALQVLEPRRDAA
jgi:predicted DNA-binding protein